MTLRKVKVAGNLLFNSCLSDVLYTIIYVRLCDKGWMELTSNEREYQATVYASDSLRCSSKVCTCEIQDNDWDVVTSGYVLYLQPHANIVILS